MAPRSTLSSSSSRITPMAEFCTNCGAPLSGPFCGRCGHRAQSASAPAQPALRLRSPSRLRLHSPRRRAANSATSSSATSFYATNFCPAPISQQPHRATTGPAYAASAHRAAAKIFRRRQSFADRRRNCSGSRSRRVWRGALWRPLGQAQSIFYYRRALVADRLALRSRRATCASCFQRQSCSR